MGVYDSYGSKMHQLKVNYGDCRLREFKIGDTVPIHDGVYLCLSGLVVVVGGKLVYESEAIYDKYDNQMSAAKVFDLTQESEEDLGWVT